MNQVRINTQYGEKSVSNFQSTQHSISLELDVAVQNCTTQEVEEAAQKLFSLCRKIVSSQKSVSVDSLLTQHPPVSATVAPAIAAPSAATPAINHASAAQPGKPATNKQIKYALELAKKSGMSIADIAALPAKFNKASFEALSAKEASLIIEGFSKKQHPATFHI